MPITIQNNKLQIRNAEGNYVSIDAVSDATVAERIAEINAAGTTNVASVNEAGTTNVGNVNSAGATQVSAINTKATEVTAQLASSGEMEDMVAQTFNTSTAYTAGTYVIQTVNNVNKLYRFNTDHAAGAWNASEVTEIKLGNEVSDLKSAMNRIETPQIVGMVDTGNSSTSSNLFQYAAMIGYHKMIYSISNGKVVLTDATSSSTYLIPVDGVSTYTFTFCRSAVVVSDTALSAVGSLLTNVTSVNSTGGKYIVFTFNTSSYPESTYSITKPVNIYKLPANWDLSDITISTPQIDGMLPSGKTVNSSNLFSKASLVAAGKYVAGIHGTTGKIYLSDSSTGALDTYIMPVDGVNTYTFTHVRSGAVITDMEYTPVGNDIVTNVTTIDSTGGSYILFSFNHNTYPQSSYEITKPVPSYYMPRTWVYEKGSVKDKIDKASGAIASNGTMTIAGRTALKDGQMIAFKGTFSSFSGFALNFYGSEVTNYITITSTEIAIKNTTTSPTPASHGLTIQNEVTLTVEFMEGNAKISLYSMGDVYTQTVAWSQTNGTVTQPQIASNGTEFSNATLVISYDCAGRKIWIFGDSYLGVTNSNRWPYYLKENGYIKNTLLNGSAGATSSGAMTSFNVLIKYGTPVYAVLATGMNDGSDVDNPSSLWAQKRDEFFTLCNDNNIIPIFVTVPTVPSVNNEQKNAWVRSSGYRYIDFASAVGADGTGAWYSGMLSSDNVHPSEKGAKALYTQVLIDLPEVTV